jgi:cell shape-determining protein MreC
MRRAIAIAVVVAAGCGGGGVPHARYQAKVDENARLRADNRRLTEERGEVRQLEKRVAQLEADNARLRDELARREAAPRPPAAPVRAETPAPPAAAPAAALVNVTQVTQTSRGIEISVDRGSDDGVGRGWIIQLVDDDGRPIAKARGAVFRVAPSYATARMKIRLKTARAHRRATVAAP